MKAVFSKRLKEARMNVGMTQRDMAAELKIPVDTYISYESNNSRGREPSMEMINKIADVLKVSIDNLFGRDNA